MRLTEFAKIVAGASLLNEAAPQVDLITRRIRYWTANGVLPGGDEEASGKHHHYTEEDAYFAAVFNSLADMGIPLDVMKAASTALQKAASGEPLDRIPTPPSMKSPEIAELMTHLDESPARRRKEGRLNRALWTAAQAGTQNVYLSLVLVKLSDSDKPGALASFTTAADLAQNVQHLLWGRFPNVLIGLTSLFGKVRF